MPVATVRKHDLYALLESCSEACRKLPGHHYRDFSWAPDYCEPGYSLKADSPGIVFGDWNTLYYDAPAEIKRRDPVGRLARILERLGYELEWEDEWSSCPDCGKAFRTSPDSYSWTQHYVWLGDCEMICLDCLDHASYLETLEDNPRKCVPPDIDPAEHGYVKYNGTYENGWHPGQDDDPKKIIAELHSQGFKRVVFRHSANSQFYIEFEAYYKPEEPSGDDE